MDNGVCFPSFAPLPACEFEPEKWLAPANDGLPASYAELADGVYWLDGIECSSGVYIVAPDGSRHAILQKCAPGEEQWWIKAPTNFADWPFWVVHGCVGGPLPFDIECFAWIARPTLKTVEIVTYDPDSSEFAQVFIGETAAVVVGEKGGLDFVGFIPYSGESEVENHLVLSSSVVGCPQTGLTSSCRVSELGTVCVGENSFVRRDGRMVLVRQDDQSKLRAVRSEQISTSVQISGSEWVVGIRPVGPSGILVSYVDGTTLQIDIDAGVEPVATCEECRTGTECE